MKTVKTLVEFDGAVRSVRVPSASRKKVTHKILLACTCEGFQFTGRCYHLDVAVKLNQADARAHDARLRERGAHPLYEGF